MSAPRQTMGQADLDAIVNEWNTRMADVPPEQFADPTVRARVADEMIAGLNKPGQTLRQAKP